MKILLSFALIFVFGFNCFGSPLVFKTQKLITREQGRNYVDLAIFETGKYKSVRIGISLETVDKSEEKTLSIKAVEDNGEVLIENYIIPPAYDSLSVSIADAPSKLKFSVRGSGEYKLYIWAN